MKIIWKSRKVYQHPTGLYGFGKLVLYPYPPCVYLFRRNGTNFPCPQDWAKEIRKKEDSDRDIGGRPGIGKAHLNVLTVPTGIADALKQKAKDLGISIPDLRRIIYQEYLDGRNNDQTC